MDTGELVRIEDFALPGVLGDCENGNFGIALKGSSVFDSYPMESDDSVLDDIEESLDDSVLGDVPVARLLVTNCPDLFLLVTLGELRGVVLFDDLGS